MSRIMVAIASILVGLALFALQDMAVKAFSGKFSMLQLMFLRSLIALVPLLLASMLVCGINGLVPARPGLAALRGLLGFVSFSCYYLAVAELPLARVVAIVFCAPILVTALSALTLKEPVGWRRWCAVGVGFIGILIITNPEEGGAVLPTMLAFFAALTYAICNLIARAIGPSDSAWTVSLFAMLVYVVLSGAVSVGLAATDVATATDLSPSLAFALRPWAYPSATELMVILSVGLGAAFSFFLLTRAYAIAPVSTIAPFEYSYILWAALFGYLLFDEIPTLRTATGAALLVASGLYVLHREMLWARRQATTDSAQEPARAWPLDRPINRPAHELGGGRFSQ